jgi:hypothetical protein
LAIAGKQLTSQPVLLNIKKYKGLFNDWQTKGLCSVVEKNDCYRSNRFSGFYPHLTKTQSFNIDTTGHDGLFTLKEASF